MKGNGETQSRLKRNDIAKRLLTSFETIDGAVAGLSPDQRAWLERELFGALKASGGVYTQRVLDAQNTMEFSAYVVKDVYLYNLIPILSWLAAGQPPDYSFQREIVYWAYVSKALASMFDFQNAVQFLTQRNRDLQRVTGRRFFGSTVDLIAANLSLQSQMIQQGIIEPFVRGDLTR